MSNGQSHRAALPAGKDRPNLDFIYGSGLDGDAVVLCWIKPRGHNPLNAVLVVYLLDLAGQELHEERGRVGDLSAALASLTSRFLSSRKDR